MENKKVLKFAQEEGYAMVLILTIITAFPKLRRQKKNRLQQWK